MDAILFFIIPALAAMVNAVAGGGSFLTFPVFMLGGLSALEANVMSTIALWPGAVASGLGYGSVKNNKSLFRNKHFISLLAISLCGGVAGAFTLLNTSEAFFKTLVPYLLLGATLIFSFGGGVIAKFRANFPNQRGHFLVAATLQILVAFYGGYFGAGIGIMTLAMLQIMGMNDIHKMNATKVLLTVAINAATMLVFVFSHLVVWEKAGMMIAGGICGGYFGAKLALKLPPAYVRRFVSLVGFGMSAYFFAK